MVDYPKDWKEVDLTNIANTFIGLVTTMTSNYTNDGAKLIRNQDIQNNKFIFKENIYLNREFAELNKSRMHKLGDVVTVHTGDIGTSAVIEESLVGSLGFATIVTRLDKKIADPYFISCYFNSKHYKDYVMSIMTGDGRNNLNMRDFNKTRLMLPSLPEQKAIAETLMTFDKHIENLEKLIEKKKMIRDGAVEDFMTGKTRLEGFEEEWEEVSFNDIIDHLKSGLSRELKNDDIGIPVVRANNIDNGILYLDRNIKYWYIEDPKGANINDFLIQKDDILVNFINSESKMGTTAIVKNTPNRKTIYTTNILRMRVKNFLNPKFIFYITFTDKYKSYIKDISKIAVNQASFTTVDYKNFECKIPTDIKEQEAIASILTSMDEEIENLEKEKAKIEKIKAGAMDDLLTGKVRLI